MNGLSPPMAQYSHEGLHSTKGLLCTLNFATPQTKHGTIMPQLKAVKPDSASSLIPVRSPLTKGITVVFFSSAEQYA
jgi:hypothetical protein